MFTGRCSNNINSPGRKQQQRKGKHGRRDTTGLKRGHIEGRRELEHGDSGLQWPPGPASARQWPPLQHPFWVTPPNPTPISVTIPIRSTCSHSNPSPDANFWQWLTSEFSDAIAVAVSGMCN